MKSRMTALLGLMTMLAVPACGEEDNADTSGATTTVAGVATTATMPAVTTTAPAATTTSQATATTTTQPPTTTTAPFDPDDILGAWLMQAGGRDSSSWLWTFSDDGTYTMAYASNTSVGEIGVYSFEGNRITLEAMPEALTDEQFGAECSDEPGVYDVSISDDDQALGFAWVADGCARRGGLIAGLTRHGS